MIFEVGKSWVEADVDVAEAIEENASGIGLFRSEFLFLNRNRLPDEEEQFLAYKHVVEAMAGKAPARPPHLRVSARARRQSASSKKPPGAILGQPLERSPRFTIISACCTPASPGRRAINAAGRSPPRRATRSSTAS